MAQIIKHRKGVIESVGGATTRKAELIIATGSAISSLDTAVVFVGHDGTSMSPVNKILTGTSTPNLTANNDFNTRIDGLPFYNTSDEKLYIIQKSGNVEVKATANTGGTGIISGSTDSSTIKFTQTAGSITADVIGGIASGSSQIVDFLDGQNVNLGGISGSSLDLTGNAKIDGNIILGGNITIGDASTDTISLGGEISSDVIPAANNTYDLGSSTDKFAEVHATTIYGSISATNGVVSGSSQITLTQTDSGSFTTDMVGEGANLYYTDARVKTKLDAEAVVSSSAQVNDLIVGTAFSSSVDNRLDTVEAAIGGGSNIDSRLSALETFSGSQEGKDDTLATYTASVDVSLSELNSYTSSLKTAISVDGANLTVLGNLDVAGTTTTIDSTTVQIGDNIIELNGSGAANGGIHVKDATAPNTETGSLVWDSTNDYWKAGVKGSEIKVLLAQGDGVVSGSAQVVGMLDSLNSYTASNDSNQTAQDDRLTSLEAATASIDTAQTAQDARLTSLEAETGSIATEQAAQDTKITALENFSSSLSTNFETTGRGIISGSSQLDGQNVNLGGISGSSLDITGNAKIDGNLVLGGNITIGDASSDTISFGGDVASDIIPNADNTHDLCSSTDRFAEVHATTLYGSIAATNGVISGSSQLDGTTLGNSADISATGSFSGSFFGDGSGITGLSTDLTISGSDGSNDQVALLTGALSFAGGTGVSATVATDTVTISVQDGSTSVKGIASFDSDDFSVASGNVSIKNEGVRAVNLNADVVGDGLELDGTNNDINVLYGSIANTAVQGNTTITVNGTANEIEITGNAAQALGGGASYTIGLPDSVTIATASISNDLSVGGNVEITGNLSVLGTTTTVDSTTVQIGDNILELNIGGAQSTAGLQVTDATAPNTVSGSLLWDGTNDYWKGGALGSEKEFARLNGSDNDTNFVQKLDSDGLLVDSVLSDDGTDATFSGDVIISGLSSGTSFVYADASKTLQAIAPTTAGQFIQWDGASFVASNEIDGGTF